MKLFHPDPLRFAAAAGVIGMVLGAILAFVTVAGVTILVFSFEKFPFEKVPM